MAVMVGMGEGGRSPFYILQLPINRPMAALLVVVVLLGFFARESKLKQCSNSHSMSLHCPLECTSKLVTYL